MTSITSFFMSVFLLILMLYRPVGAQQQTVIPNFWDPQERFIKPNVKDLPRLKFLTTTDFPPFSFIDQDKRLTGFHVDMARAICAELEVLPVCQIQAVPFAELLTELKNGGGDAILAGLAITNESRRELTFSRPYFHLPARFIAKKGARFNEPLWQSLAGKEIGVVDGTAHAALAAAEFGDLRIRLFETEDAAFRALEKDEVAAVFGDALRTSFRIQKSTNASGCCTFVGRAYLSPEYLGKGLAVALSSENRELTDAIDFALKSINDKGTFGELYLRYFPISLF